MLTFVVLILCISFYLYTILGGADFGAGIIELFTGNKSIKPIYKAIAPIWEANHMWLILSIVIVFNGFPPIYAEISTSLHIPIFIILIGIIMRGTAFTFRHYDTHEDESHKYYHFFFRTSSLLTSLFLGITLGAMILGRITDDPSATFLERYIMPWFNPFCLTMGLFASALFAYIASIYIIGETDSNEDRAYFSKIAKRFSILTFVLGAIILGLAYIYETPFMDNFIHHPVAWVSLSLASIFLFVIIKNMNEGKIIRIRAWVAIQVALMMSAWATSQFPTVVYLKNGNNLTLLNAAAGDSTLYYLCIALIIGSVIIFPALFFLFKTFKG